MIGPGEGSILVGGCGAALVELALLRLARTLLFRTKPDATLSRERELCLVVWATEELVHLFELQTVAVVFTQGSESRAVVLHVPFFGVWLLWLGRFNDRRLSCLGFAPYSHLPDCDSKQEQSDRGCQSKPDFGQLKTAESPHLSFSIAPFWAYARQYWFTASH